MPGRYLYICNRAIYGYTVNSRTGPNVTSVSDTVVNKAITYGYDEFDRLTSLTVNSGQVQNYTYGYDRYGNRVAQNALQGGTNFSTTVNAATNQLVGYTYDAAGNMTNDGFHAYSYDAEGNILTVDGGATATYVYDALNHRVWSNNAGSTYEYTYDAGGHRVSSWVEPSNQGNEGRIYWDGQQIAYRSSDGTTYFDHQDYLGTERMRTNSAGALAATFSTLPWGDGYVANIVDAAAGQDSLQFAGLDADVNSSGAPMSDHAQFRNYSFQQGRWLAPDPYDGSYDITNPQSFNRYAYAANNPLTFVDPSGLEFSVGPGGGGASCANNPVCVAMGGGTGGGGGGMWGDPWGGPTSLLDGYGGYMDEFDFLNSFANPIGYNPVFGVEGNVIGYNPVFAQLDWLTFPFGAPSNPASSAPPGVCQAVVVGQALSQMNSVVSTANQNIKNGLVSGTTGTLVKAAILFAGGRNWPAAGTLVTAAAASEAWTILQQVPPVFSGIYQASKQAESSQACGGGGS